MDDSQYFQEGQESPSGSSFTSALPVVINTAPIPAPDSELGSDFMAGSVGSVNLPSEPEHPPLDEQEESDQRTETADTVHDPLVVTYSDLQASSGSDFHIGMEVNFGEEDTNASLPESGVCEFGSAVVEDESPEYVEYKVDADEGVGDSDEEQDEGSFASCQDLDNGEEGEMNLVDVAGSDEIGSQSEGSDDEGEDGSMKEAAACTASKESGGASGMDESGSDGDWEMADDEEESQFEDEDDEAAEPEAACLFMQGSVVDQMQGFESAFPDAITNHFLHSAGFDSSDPRITHLVSLAAQKYLTDILRGAHTICKAKTAAAVAAVASGESGESGEPDDTPLPTTLTMEDLNAAAKERGIEMPVQFP